VGTVTACSASEKAGPAPDFEPLLARMYLVFEELSRAQVEKLLAGLRCSASPQAGQLATR
jgi:hypothetical protein